MKRLFRRDKPIKHNGKYAIYVPTKGVARPILIGKDKDAIKSLEEAVGGPLERIYTGTKHNSLVVDKNAIPLGKDINLVATEYLKCSVTCGNYIAGDAVLVLLIDGEYEFFTYFQAAAIADNFNSIRACILG